MLRRHGLPALFALLIALHLVPIWTVRYEPTCDGPSHLYNAWVLQALVRGTAPPAVHDALAVRWALFPNWLAHVVLAVSIAAVGPLIAEKLLLSLLLAGLGAAAWILAGSGRPPDGGGPSDDSAAPVHVAAFFALPLLVS